MMHVLLIRNVLYKYTQIMLLLFLWVRILELPKILQYINVISIFMKFL